MQKQKNCTTRVNDQTMRMRRLYSKIGEPLPVDVIIDLYRHLDQALELADESGKAFRGKKTVCGRPH